MLLIFSVVGSVYVLRGNWVRTRLFDSNFNRFELLFYGARALKKKLKLKKKCLVGGILFWREMINPDFKF